MIRWRKRQALPSSSPFFHRVFLPGLRSTLLIFAVFAIGFGSWLETNRSIDDCAFRKEFTVQHVSLYRNLSSEDVLPDSVSFGLWRHCFIYALNCTCTAPRLNYGLDALTTLRIATTGNGTTILDTVSSNTSYWRVVPLALATAVVAVAFLFGLVVNFLERPRWQWINAVMIFATVVLVAASFGYTYHEYKNAIRKACGQLAGRYCVTAENGTEVVLLAIGLGLIGASLLVWLYIPSQKPTNDSTMLYESDGRQAIKNELYFDHQEHVPPIKTAVTRRPSDPLDPWREAGLFDERLRWRDYQQLDDTSLPPPPPKASSGNHGRYSRYHRSSNQQQHQHHQHHHKQQQRRYSSDQDYDSADLHPPARPFANNGARRGSHGSGNTFGAAARISRTSTITMEGAIGEDQPYYYRPPSSSGSGHSPTHAYSNGRRRSSTPSIPLTTSGRSSSPQRAATPNSTHTLGPAYNSNSNGRYSRAVITDERINAYLSGQNHPS
ncbi:hypothetical protein BX666DRAFT_2118019 [Dichotomocladium elegans]|nr:hypothetical protein BX666DRAFT_2118019 [Dichotomocladium elegans]